MNCLLKKTLPRPFPTYTGSTACAGVSKQGFCQCQTHGSQLCLCKPSQGVAAAGTTSQLCPRAGSVAQQLHVHLIPTSFCTLSKAGLHFRTPWAEGEIPSVPTDLFSGRCNGLKANISPCLCNFFPIPACPQQSLSPAVSMMIYRTIKSDTAVTGPSENYPPSQ